MQVCSKKFSMLILAALLAGAGNACLFGQSIEMPAMPEAPAMPSMPSVSGSGSFYTPTFPSSSGTSKSASAKTDSSTKSSETVLSDGTTTSDVLSSLLGVNTSTLTASDISSLYDSGLFSSLSGLDSTSSLSSYSTSATTNVLLQQVLNSLNDLKSKQNNASAAEKQVLENTQTDSETFKQREPTILRFKINGYNIADSLTKVFFSEPEADGSFLLTADRKYYSNQKLMTETFYMLFKTVSSTGSSVFYKVQPAIVQDNKNENSFVYKLMNKHNLTAEKTGNLVVMHVNDDLTADMLLDIDKR